MTERFVTNKMNLKSPKSNQQPRTQVEELRVLLKDIELRVARLKTASSQDTKELLSMFDQAFSSMAQLEAAGGIATSENSHFETVKAQLNSKRQLFLSRFGGEAALANYRKQHNPPKEHWWWYLDQIQADERRSRAKRVLFAGGIIVVLLVLLFVVYQTFWKPDPILQAAIGLRTDAENLLIDGNNEEALISVNQALELTPEDPYLLILRGVIYQSLDETEFAENDFEKAKEDFTDEDLFYSNRAGYYNMAGQPEAALLDAERAIELNPDSPMAFIRKAQAYELLNDPTMAIKYYELASDIAERTGNPQIQVIARMSLGQLLQALPSLPENGEQ